MKLTHFLGWFLLVFLLTETAGAQTSYQFTYDASGNRLTRSITLKSARIPADSLQAKQDQAPLEDQIGLQKTRIFPNPTKGMLRIDIPSLSREEATINVFDPNGKLVIHQAAIPIDNKVDLSTYPSGFYIMTIQIGQAKKEWKIIKE